MKKYFLSIVLLSGCLLFFISCEDILFEKDISKNQITLIAPVNNAPFFSTGVTFSWETAEGATKYQLQIAKPDFENPMQIVLDTIVTNTNFTQQLPIGKYEWRVRALNESYETNYSTRSFSIISNADFQSNVVILNAPANNLVTNTSVQNLNWQSIIGATSYQLQIIDRNNTIINDQSITATSLSYPFSEGTFQWKVRATNGTEQTLYSSRSILVDITAPNTPTLATPSNLSTTTIKDIVFQWNRTPIVGSVEKDSIYIYKNNALTILSQKNEAISPFSVNLDSGLYYWFIKSFDQAGNKSNRSSVFSFTIN
jgi:hypothetical protein